MRAALDTLIEHDPRLARIERAAGPLPWRVRAGGFPGLLQILVGQQISNQAALAIWLRLAALPGALMPEGLLALSDAALRTAGLSRPKAAHARLLAAAFVSGQVSGTALERLSDADAVAAITAVRGLGPWTAEVYLLFALERQDVFPAGDVAIASAAADILGLSSRPDPKALRALAEVWRPSRALAARLLWHHWRQLTGRPSFDDVTPGPSHVYGVFTSSG